MPPPSTEHGVRPPEAPEAPAQVFDQAARQAAGPLTEAVAIMARLRGPQGCPWDREQTFDSIKKHTLEETYEVFDAIERRGWAGLPEGMGGVLLPGVLLAPLAGG